MHLTLTYISKYREWCIEFVGQVLRLTSAKLTSYGPFHWSFSAVTADSKSRWPHGRKAYFRRGQFRGVNWMELFEARWQDAFSWPYDCWVRICFKRLSFLCELCNVNALNVSRLLSVCAITRSLNTVANRDPRYDVLSSRLFPPGQRQFRSPALGLISLQVCTRCP